MHRVFMGGLAQVGQECFERIGEFGDMWPLLHRDLNLLESRGFHQELLAPLLGPGLHASPVVDAAGEDNGCATLALVKSSEFFPAEG